MALLPSEPKQQKALGIIIGAVAVFYLYWSFYHTPRVEAMNETLDRVSNLQTRNEGAQVQSLRGGIPQLESRALEYERHVRRLEELIPASEQVAALINDIQLEARRLGITVRDLSPLPDEPGTHYTRHSYALEVVGDYHDIGEFLTSIASGSRIINPIRVTIAPYDESQGRVGTFEAPILLTFEIETFILPDGNAAPAAQVGAEGEE